MTEHGGISSLLLVAILIACIGFGVAAYRAINELAELERESDV